MQIMGIPEAWLRPGVFLGVLVVMGLLEVLAPRRTLVAPKGRRWLTNLTIVGVDSLLVRLMAVLAVPLAAVAAAAWAEARGIGLLALVGLPVWLEVLIAILVLDLAIWAQHIASHKIPLLWRLHQMHHADRDIDVTTGIRFHPVEIGLSMFWKIAVVVALGAPAVAVLLFEVVLNGCALFNHSNVRLPLGLDRALRRIIVTPDMHRVHHSVLSDEHDTNYGFNLSIWDRWFGTYTDQPKAGHDGMTIGLAPYQHDGPTRIGWSISLPFMRRSEAEAPPGAQIPKRDAT